MNNYNTNGISFDYIVPYNKELRAEGYMPYRASEELMNTIEGVYTSNRYRYSEVAKRMFKQHKYLRFNLGRIVTAVTRYYLDHENQFGAKMENIYSSTMVRIHRQIVREMIDTEGKPKRYMPCNKNLIYMMDTIFSQALSDVIRHRYYDTNDDMVKKRPGIGLRERYSMKESTIRYYESL